MSNSEDYEATFARQREVKMAFSPTAPIQRRDLFAGRSTQMVELIDAVDEPGQHVVLYGERGVGKTSIATVSSQMMQGQYLSIKVNCISGDSFSSIWTRALREVLITQSIPSSGFNSQPQHHQQSIIESLALPDVLQPDHVRLALATISAQKPLVIFFDEFDRLADTEVHRLFADTIKTLSDQMVAATICIVGVADNVNELITEHASVERALAQIHMPRMSTEELQQIVTKGLGSVSMTVTGPALRNITALSQGLPHYTHLLAQQAALQADLRVDTVVSEDDVKIAVEKALSKTQESISSLWYRATYSSRENLYKQVLLACAIAPADSRGYFSAASVRETLSSIMDRRMEIPSFSMHLNSFSSDRGPVLKKEGSQRNFRYRFTDPLLKPFVLMRGLADDLIAPDQILP